MMMEELPLLADDERSPFARQHTRYFYALTTIAKYLPWIDAIAILLFQISIYFLFERNDEETAEFLLSLATGAQCIAGIVLPCVNGTGMFNNTFGPGPFEYGMPISLLEHTESLNTHRVLSPASYNPNLHWFEPMVKWGGLGLASVGGVTLVGLVVDEFLAEGGHLRGLTRGSGKDYAKFYKAIKRIMRRNPFLALLSARTLGAGLSYSDLAQRVGCALGFMEEGQASGLLADVALETGYSVTRVVQEGCSAYQDIVRNFSLPLGKFIPQGMDAFPMTLEAIQRLGNFFSGNVVFWRMWNVALDTLILSSFGTYRIKLIEYKKKVNNEVQRRLAAYSSVLGGADDNADEGSALLSIQSRRMPLTKSDIAISTLTTLYLSKILVFDELKRFYWGTSDAAQFLSAIAHGQASGVNSLIPASSMDEFVSRFGATEFFYGPHHDIPLLLRDVIVSLNVLAFFDPEIVFGEGSQVIWKVFNMVAAGGLTLANLFALRRNWRRMSKDDRRARESYGHFLLKFVKDNPFLLTYVFYLPTMLALYASYGQTLLCDLKKLLGDVNFDLTGVAADQGCSHIFSDHAYPPGEDLADNSKPFYVFIYALRRLGAFDNAKALAGILADVGFKGALTGAFFTRLIADWQFKRHFAEDVERMYISEQRKRTQSLGEVVVDRDNGNDVPEGPLTSESENDGPDTIDTLRADTIDTLHDELKPGIGFSQMNTSAILAAVDVAPPKAGPAPAPVKVVQPDLSDDEFERRLRACLAAYTDDKAEEALANEARYRVLLLNRSVRTLRFHHTSKVEDALYLAALKALGNFFHVVDAAQDSVDQVNKLVGALMGLRREAAASCGTVLDDVLVTKAPAADLYLGSLEYQRDLALKCFVIAEQVRAVKTWPADGENVVSVFNSISQFLQDELPIDEGNRMSLRSDLVVSYTRLERVLFGHERDVKYEELRQFVEHLRLLQTTLSPAKELQGPGPEGNTLRLDSDDDDFPQLSSLIPAVEQLGIDKDGAIQQDGDDLKETATTLKLSEDKRGDSPVPVDNGEIERIQLMDAMGETESNIEKNKETIPLASLMLCGIHEIRELLGSWSDESEPQMQQKGARLLAHAQMVVWLLDRSLGLESGMSKESRAALGQVCNQLTHAPQLFLEAKKIQPLNEVEQDQIARDAVSLYVAEAGMTFTRQVHDQENLARFNDFTAYLINYLLRAEGANWKSSDEMFGLQPRSIASDAFFQVVGARYSREVPWQTDAIYDLVHKFVPQEVLAHRPEEDADAVEDPAILSHSEVLDDQLGKGDDKVKTPQSPAKTTPDSAMLATGRQGPPAEGQGSDMVVLQEREHREKLDPRVAAVGQHKDTSVQRGFFKAIAEGKIVVNPSLSPQDSMLQLPIGPQTGPQTLNQK